MTVWNGLDKAASITITGSGLVATQGTEIGGGGNSGFGVSPGMVRADIGSASGNSDNWQFEVTINAITSSFGELIGIGVSNASQSLSTDFDTNGIGYHADGFIVGSSGSINTGVTYGAGDVIGVHKTSSGITWIKNGTNVSTQTTLPSGTLLPSAIVSFPGDQVTANFVGTFAHPIGGASAWVVDPTALPARSITYNKTLPSLFQVASLSTGEAPLAPAVGTGGYFPDTIAAVLQGHAVRCDFLVMFDFASGSMRLWQGFGTLHTIDGNDWQGIGQLGQISDLESAIGGGAPQAKFTLSGVDPTIVADALDQSNEVYGRDCNVYMQFFDANFNCLDNPYVVWAGSMDQMKIRQSGPDACQVDLTAETIFARRSLPPLGNLTDREQQRFYPGDNGLATVPSLMAKTSIWPVILPQS